MAAPLESDYILLIMSCVRYKSKAFMQKKTWLMNHVPATLPYFHVIGDEKLQQPFDFNHTSRILRVKTPDDYNSLPKKQIASFFKLRQTFFLLRGQGHHRYWLPRLHKYWLHKYWLHKHRHLRHCVFTERVVVFIE